LHFRISILVLCFCVYIVACDKVERKGNHLLDKTNRKIEDAKQTIIDKKDSLVDKVFPRYDFDSSDTESNKKRFREHLTIPISNDIKEIYTYGDFLGIDYKVLIAFKCEKATIEKIVEVKKMKQYSVSENHAMKFSVEFKWWDQEKIDTIRPYKVGKDAEYWQYLWYDPISKQAFYEEYSL
jgi:hypothetical protein